MILMNNDIFYNDITILSNFTKKTLSVFDVWKSGFGFCH